MTTVPSILITDRPPTKRDEDEHGEVLYLNRSGWWVLSSEGYKNGDQWTHTPLWVDPGPTLEEQLEEDLKRLRVAITYEKTIEAYDRIASYVRQQLKANSEAS